MTTVDKAWLPTGHHWGLTIHHVPTNNGGTIAHGNPAMVLHTTEGGTLGGAESTLFANSDEPHVAIDTLTGIVHQYIPFNQSSRALAHPAGTPETNRAGQKIQIEIVGFTQAVGGPATHPNAAAGRSINYSHLAALCCLIEHRVDIPRLVVVPFLRPGHTYRLDPVQWMNAHGYVGHSMCPNNDHEDPGALDTARLFLSMGAQTRAHRGSTH
jgi:hypothetical protein